MSRAARITTACIVLILIGILIVTSLSETQVDFVCKGSFDGTEERVELHFRLSQYRWWVGVWSESDGNILMELPDGSFEYLADVADEDPIFQIYKSPEELIPVGRFSKISDKLTVQTAFGRYNGSCRATK